MNFHSDVWSSGQMGSKLWLCRELENLRGQHAPPKPQVIWILGGWCGLMGQLLLSREKLSIEAVRSFDIDAECEIRADQLNNYWQWQQWRFKAFTADCNQLDYAHPQGWASRSPDIVINTATEHFDSLNWWERIPTGTLCALQSNDMAHDEHIAVVKNLDEMKSIYKMREIAYVGQLHFDYNNATSFTRFMLIGYK